MFKISKSLTLRVTLGAALFFGVHQMSFATPTEQCHIHGGPGDGSGFLTTNIEWACTPDPNRLESNLNVSVYNVSLEERSNGTCEISYSMNLKCLCEAPTAVQINCCGTLTPTPTCRHSAATWEGFRYNRNSPSIDGFPNFFGYIYDVPCTTSLTEAFSMAQEDAQQSVDSSAWDLGGKCQSACLAKMEDIDWNGAEDAEDDLGAGTTQCKIPHSPSFD